MFEMCLRSNVYLTEISTFALTYLVFKSYYRRRGVIVLGAPPPAMDGWWQWRALDIPVFNSMEQVMFGKIRIIGS